MFPSRPGLSRQGITVFQRGLALFDNFLAPGEFSADTSMMVSTLSQVEMVSAQDFAKSMAMLDEVFDAVSEPLQLLRSRSLAYYRKLVREKPFDKGLLTGTREAKEIHYLFFTATSWQQVLRAFDMISFATREPKVSSKVGDSSPLTLPDPDKEMETKMSLFEFFETIVLETVTKANHHPEVIKASKGMRAKIQKKQILRLMADATEVFADAAFPEAKSVVDHIADAGTKMMLMDAPKRPNEQVADPTPSPTTTTHEATEEMTPDGHAETRPSLKDDT